MCWFQQQVHAESRKTRMHVRHKSCTTFSPLSTLTLFMLRVYCRALINTKVRALHSDSYFAHVKMHSTAALSCSCMRAPPRVIELSFSAIFNWTQVSELKFMCSASHRCTKIYWMHKTDAALPFCLGLCAWRRFCRASQNITSRLLDILICKLHKLKRCNDLSDWTSCSM